MEEGEESDSGGVDIVGLPDIGRLIIERKDSGSWPLGLGVDALAKNRSLGDHSMTVAPVRSFVTTTSVRTEALDGARRRSAVE